MDTTCECPICYDPITSETGKVSMACAHSFHFSCIAGWFGKQCDKNMPETCPCCRRQMSEKEAMPIIQEEDESESDDESESEDESIDAESESDDDFESFSSEADKVLIKLKETAGLLKIEKNMIEASMKNIECIIEDGEVNPGIEEIRRRLEVDELYLPASIRRDIFNNSGAQINFTNHELLRINKAAFDHISMQNNTFEEMLKLCDVVTTGMPNLLTLEVTVNVENSQRVTQQVAAKRIIFNPEEEEDEETA